MDTMMRDPCRTARTCPCLVGEAGQLGAREQLGDERAHVADGKDRDPGIGVARRGDQVR